MDFGVSPMVRAKAPNWIIVIGKFVARHIAISCVLLVFAFGVSNTATFMRVCVICYYFRC